MEALITLVGNIPLSTVIVFLVAVAFLVKTYLKHNKFVCDKHDVQTNREEILNNLVSDFGEIKHILSEQNTAIQELKENQKRIEEKQQKEEEEKKKREMNNLRNNLLQSYHYYTNADKNPLLSWTEMEKDAFDNLFMDYENLGGNGYMHTEVEPAMKSLIVIPMYDSQKISDLMQSRK